MSHSQLTSGVPNAGAKEAVTAGEVVARKRRILIVDDNVDMLVSLKKVLEAALSVCVDTAADGREALEAITHRSYSILVTDLKMPHVSGMQLIQEVQNRRLPVTIIVLTAHGSIDEAVQAMQLGAHNFLTKPPNTKHLCLIVLRLATARAAG